MYFKARQNLTKWRQDFQVADNQNESLNLIKAQTKRENHLRTVGQKKKWNEILARALEATLNKSTMATKFQQLFLMGPTNTKD